MAERRQLSFCAIPLPRTVYAGPRTWEEFDRLDLPESVFEWKENEYETEIRADGQKWETRCHAKVLGELGTQVSVIFQWFEHRVAEGGAA